ncbi:hypothetical protein HYT26_01465 [Candidatus Pacearchaeota archaeon]|nr:hypothetical protein [Candidatus Pacearchaeota archaeon]
MFFFGWYEKYEDEQARAVKNRQKSERESERRGLIMKTAKAFWKIMWGVVFLTMLVCFRFTTFFTACLLSKIPGMPVIGFMILGILITGFINLYLFERFWEPMIQKIEKRIKEAQVNEVSC